MAGAASLGIAASRLTEPGGRGGAGSVGTKAAGIQLGGEQELPLLPE